MKGLILTILLAILCSVVSIFVYDRFFAQKIVAIDIRGYIAEQKNLYLSGKLNDEELRKNIDKLEAIVQKIPKRKVVIMGDAVVRNAEVIKLSEKKEATTAR